MKKVIFSYLLQAEVCSVGPMENVFYSYCKLKYVKFTVAKFFSQQLLEKLNSIL